MAPLLAVAACALGSWCAQDVPCSVLSRERDPQGLEHVVVAEQIGSAALPPDRAMAAWIVDPGFEPFLAEVGAFRTEVRTPDGTFRSCVPPSVAARQDRPSVPGAPLMSGGVVLLSFDPAPNPMPRFPLDPAFEAARAEGLLTPAQAARLDGLDRLLSPRARALAAAWREFAQSPYLAASRTALLSRLRSFSDPAPAFSRDDLRPERFFDRPQRERLRAEGHAIPGRCLVQLSAGSARVQLEACPLSQLEREWDRVRSQLAAVDLPALHARPDRAHEEVERLALEMSGLTPDGAARRVLALLGAIDGMAPGAHR